jgi:hypothetical protein
MGRNFSSVAASTTLSASVTSGSTSLPLTAVSGYPTAPFTGVLDPGLASEEIVTVTALVGLNATVTRGQDGSSAVAHGAGAAFRHMVTGRDLQESQDHNAATTAVHGLGASSAVVGTRDAQSLDDKTFLSLDGLGAPLTVRAAVGQTAQILDLVNESGTVVAGVTPAGRVVTPGVDGSSSSTLTAGTATTVPLIVKGAAAQSASVVSVRDSTDTEKIALRADGHVTGTNVTASATVTGATVAATGPVTAATAAISGNATAAGLAITETSAAAVPLSVQGAAAQSANLTEWKNSAGTVLASVDETGNADFPNLLPGSATKVSGGSTTAATDGSGNYNLIAAIISATGWSQVDRLQVWNGDGVTRPNCVIGLAVTLPASTGNVNVRIGSTGGVVASLSFKFEWMAWGH